VVDEKLITHTLAVGSVLVLSSPLWWVIYSFWMVIVDASCCLHMLQSHKMSASLLPVYQLHRAQITFQFCCRTWLSNVRQFELHHNHISARPSLFRQALQWPWPVLNQFSRHHWGQGRLNHGWRSVGSSTGNALITEADTQFSCHWLLRSLYGLWCLLTDPVLTVLREQWPLKGICPQLICDTELEVQCLTVLVTMQ